LDSDPFNRALASYVKTRGSLILVLALGGDSFVTAAPTGWRPFSDNSPWNQPIPANARTDPDSSAAIADFALRGALYINIRDWSIPVYFVDAEHTPRHKVYDLRPGIFGKGFEFPRRIPIPANAVASPPVDGDNHLCIIDQRRKLEWGMWWARKNSKGGWGTGLGAVTDLAGTGVSAPWYAEERQLDAHRARASGFPLIAGLICVEEIRAGRIEHALVFAYDRCRTGFFVPPASTAQVTVLGTKNSTGIPMGGRIQLDPSWDVEHSALTRSGKTIARALQEYGAYCGDYAGANVLYAENSPAAVKAWEGLLNAEELRAVFTPEMIREHFRVLDMGNVLPGQNCEIPPPYCLSFQFAEPDASARIDYFTRTIAVTVPASANLTKLVPTFTVFERGTRVVVNGAEQSSGRSGHDFTRPVVYELVAPDGTTTSWKVIVKKS
jgi:hypothetical protein